MSASITQTMEMSSCAYGFSVADGRREGADILAAAAAGGATARSLEVLHHRFQARMGQPG